MTEATGLCRGFIFKHHFFPQSWILRTSSSGLQHISSTGIPEYIPSYPGFPWSHNQWVQTSYNNVTPTVASGVGLQASLGDVPMEPGSQSSLHNKLTKDRSGSKKRKINASGKVKSKTKVVHADSETTEGTNTTEAAVALCPSQQQQSQAALPIMNHLVLTFESNQLSVQCMMKEQQQQFSSQLELLHAKVSQMASAVPLGQSSTHGFLNEEDGDDDLPTPPKKGKQTRCHFLQDTQVVDRDVDMVTYSQFLNQRLEKHC
ncbi:hypothetical protein EDC04DRAFT_2613439 [Pisolithus marmoratus]|nr:hypothetical protein EDC04DRAFT_2613439 [Pisolithus marmoratus]